MSSTANYFHNTIRIYLLLLCATQILSEDEYPWSSVQEKKRILCESRECQIISKIYLKSQNTRANPCTDFYEYACGNWLENYPLPVDAEEWTVATTLQEKALNDRRQILEGELKFSSIGQVYKTCMKRPHLARGTINWLQMYTKKIDIWPVPWSPFRKGVKTTKKPWWILDNYYIRITGESAFFDIHTIFDPSERHIPMFDLRPLSSPYGSIIRFQEWESADRLGYLQFLKNLINLCLISTKREKEKASIEREIENLFRFRRELENIAMRTFSGGHSYYNLKTVKDLQHIFDHRHLKSTTEPMDWLETVRSIYENNLPENVNAHTPLNVQNPIYFHDLAKLLDATAEETLVNHVHMYFIERHIILDLPLRNSLNAAVIFNKEQTGRVRHIQAQWKECTSQFDTERVLSKSYVNKLLPLETKLSTKTIVEEVKHILEREIQNSAWLDANVKKKLVTKVRNMQIWSGYPPWFTHPKLEARYKYLSLNVANTTTFLIPHCNTIFVPTASLQLPLAFADKSDVIKYATLGTMIARAAYHAFNAEGFKSELQGTEVKWKLDKLLMDYKIQQKCFVDQYERYPMKEFRDATLPKRDGNLNYDENMANIMGVKLAYQLYKKALYKNNGICNVPAQFQSFSCEQLFFIALANTQCGIISPNIIKWYIKASPHSLPRYKVAGPLLNMPEFQKAFQCERSEMTQFLQSKCDLWK